MKYTYTAKTAFTSLRHHKSRSALTILGIVIGVVSIIFIVSMGGGAEDLIVGEVASLGAEIIWIEPGREPQGPTDLTTGLLNNTLKDKDILALMNKSNVPHLEAIAPSVSVSGSVAYEGETYRPFIIGWSAEFFREVFKIFPDEGILFDELAIRNQEKVAVIGSKVKEELFGGSEAVGKNIKINGKNFRVVGVLPSKGQVLFFDVGELVLIPHTTAQSYLLGIDHFHEVWARVDHVDNIPVTVRDIEATLRERHSITDPKKDDFYILTQDNLLDQIGSILGIITAAIGSIVAIALVVGGVGVMNIMLVSVTERTREIGLRKALGATEKDIVLQFLTEAVMLTLIGGVVGLLIGAVFSYAAAVIITEYAGLSWSFEFPYFAALLAFAVSAAVGLLFGIYPARQAARKSPIEALRYE
jgi:putative ABC transport system permease protein